MNNKIDLRVIKTYEKLTAAFGEMMRSVPFDDVTVFDLCEKADIRRATFYKHFNDKYDFFKSIVGIILTNMDKKVCAITKNSSTKDYILIFVKEIINYLNERPKILSNMLKSNAFPVIFDIITGCTHESLENHLKSEIEEGMVFATDPDIFASFINGGIATLLIDCFKKRNLTEQEVIAKIEEILNKIFG